MLNLSHWFVLTYDVVDDTDRVSREVKAIGSVRPSVCPFARLSVCFQSLYLLNRLVFELGFVCVCVCHDHNYMPWDWKLKSQLKVQFQCQMVTRSVWPRSSIEDSFSSWKSTADGWSTRQVLVALLSTDRRGRRCISSRYSAWRRRSRSSPSASCYTKVPTYATPGTSWTSS